MPIKTTPADLRVFRVGSNFDQFAASGNPWVTPETWNTHVGIAQDQLAATGLRTDALDFVRPGTPAKTGPIEPQVITRVEDGAHQRSSRMRTMWQDLNGFATGYQAAPDYLAPITEDDLTTFRRSVAKIDVPHNDGIGWDVDLDRVKGNHARWMADEHAKIEQRRQQVLAHRAKLALEEAEDA
jgi:hypothetical protein